MAVTSPEQQLVRLAKKEVPAPNQPKSPIAGRVPAELKAWVERHARDTGQTITDVLTDALERQRPATAGAPEAARQAVAPSPTGAAIHSDRHRLSGRACMRPAHRQPRTNAQLPLVTDGLRQL
jgi:hypothetical protein